MRDKGNVNVAPPPQAQTPKGTLENLNLNLNI